MTDVKAKLAQISGNDQKSRTDEYKALLAQVLASAKLPDIQLWIDHMASDSTPLIISRVVLQEFATSLVNLNADLHVEVAQYAIEKLTPRVVAFEEQLGIVREHLSGIYEERQEWTDAAKVLAGISLESNRLLTADYKCDKYVKIAQLYLEAEEHFEADRFLTKASMAIHDAKDVTVQIRYKVCFARISHYKRKFLEAAMRFYELSQIILLPDERMVVLETAVICAVLAPAGPNRSRLLALLYKDERSKEIIIFPILEKMFLDRILRKEELNKFVVLLKEKDFPLQGENNVTAVLDKAVREHNLLSASKVYNNIRFDELGVLLDVPAEDAEKLASTMIAENRLDAHIDQLKKIIYFQEENTINLWDTHIATACNTVNSLVDLISVKYPKFVDQF